MRAAAILLVALLLTGCARDAEEPPTPRPTSGEPPPSGPPLRFGGRVLDALTGEPLPGASARLDLSQVLPCARQGIGWRSWDLEAHDGRFGPLEVPRPRSDDVAFFLHVSAPGYAENATHIGPQQARGDLGNMTVLLHPDASVRGAAPPGTLVALDAPPFPRIAVTDANGTFEFPRARGVDAALVAATAIPTRLTVRAPTELDIPPSDAKGWTLEGAVRSPEGAPVAADVVAWNGTQPWSVARASSAGAFSMPLPPEPATLRIEARTPDARLGGVLQLDVRGPPALRETIILRALC